MDSSTLLIPFDWRIWALRQPASYQASRGPQARLQSPRINSVRRPQHHNNYREINDADSIELDDFDARGTPST